MGAGGATTSGLCPKKSFWMYFSDYQLWPGNSSKKADQTKTSMPLQDSQLPKIELGITGH